MFSATVTGSFCAALGWPSTLIRFLVAVFGGFPGNLDLPMFTVFNGRPQPRSEIPLPFYSRFVPTAERCTDSIAYTIIPTYTLRHTRAYTARADTRTWRPPRRVGLSLSLSLSSCCPCSVNVGRARSRSAAATKYARTCQTESLSYQGRLRRYTIVHRACPLRRPSRVSTAPPLFAHSRISISA